MKKAVALKYNPYLPAPFVLAKGKGDLAEKLLSLADEYEVPIIEQAALTDNLIYLDISDFISEEMYEAVAEIFRFVYLLKDAL